MKTDNELLAEFMGLHWHLNGTISNYPTVIKMQMGIDKKEDLKFDSSWDWLMPVVEKIKQIQDLIHFDERGNELIQAIEKYICLVQIKDAHMYIVEFVKWYNENKSVNH